MLRAPATLSFGGGEPVFIFPTGSEIHVLRMRGFGAAPDTGLVVTKVCAVYGASSVCSCTVFIMTATLSHLTARGNTRFCEHAKGARADDGV